MSLPTDDSTQDWSMKPTPRQWKAWLLTDTPASRRQAALGRAYRRWRQFSRNPLSLFGLAILLLLIAVAAFGPMLVSEDPLRQVLAERLMPPGTATHWFGTDQLGRDILSRLVHGARLTLSIAILVFSPWLLLVLIACLLPAFLGESHYAFLSYAKNFRQTPAKRDSLI